MACRHSLSRSHFQLWYEIYEAKFFLFFPFLQTDSFCLTNWKVAEFNFTDVLLNLPTAGHKARASLFNVTVPIRFNKGL